MGPRLAFTFEPLRDNHTKIYGSFSRYFLPVASNTSIRGAGAELDYTRYNVLNDVNGRACPDTGTTNCTVTRDGSVQDPSSFESQNLESQS